MYRLETEAFICECGGVHALSGPVGPNDEQQGILSCGRPWRVTTYQEISVERAPSWNKRPFIAMEIIVFNHRVIAKPLFKQGDTGAGPARVIEVTS